MLTELGQRDAVRQAAPFFSAQPVLQTAIEAATQGEPPFYKYQVGLLNRAIREVNFLLRSPEKRDASLVNICGTTEESKKYPVTNLPELFSWADRSQRKKWTQTLLATLPILNEDIRGGYYQNPGSIDNGNPADVFRFFLLDGYCRWNAVLVTDGQPEKRQEERDRANVIANALCEAAVIAAEKGDAHLKELVGWMVRHDWIAARWGMSETLVRRAETISKNQPVIFEQSNTPKG
ncbi:hypothetical protein HY214_04460 [Candidatus Roizmanbacteria bacterium]|nr:hypothetical protein [Candidatus Roizmanbacteria bacterium]